MLHVAAVLLALVLNTTVAPAGPVHSTSRLLEQIIAGAVVSTTVTVKLHVFVFRLAS